MKIKERIINWIADKFYRLLQKFPFYYYDFSMRGKMNKTKEKIVKDVLKELKQKYDEDDIGHSWEEEKDWVEEISELAVEKTWAEAEKELNIKSFKQDLENSKRLIEKDKEIKELKDNLEKTDKVLISLAQDYVELKNLLKVNLVLKKKIQKETTKEIFKEFDKMIKEYKILVIYQEVYKKLKKNYGVDGK